LGCSMPERVRRASLVLAVGTGVFAAAAVLPQGLPGSLRAAAAAEAVFTVGNYPVEARADNAVAAKDRALSEGQQAAFRSLLRRLVPVTAFQRLKQLPAVRAGDLLEGVKVRAERNSATDYIASLDFSFQSKGVRDLLRREGIPFTDEQAPVVTLVPVWLAAGGAAKVDAAWTSVWSGLDLEHALTPGKLQPLKAEVTGETINALLAGDGGAMRALARAYQSELVLLAAAAPDPGGGRLNVTLTGRDAVGAFTLKRAFRLDRGDPAYTSELAAVVLLGILEGRWKSIRSGGGAGAPGTAGDLLIAVEFRGMGEWQEISRKLSAIPGVEELEVAGLSARGARVTLRYAEGAERLAQSLSQQGLGLRNVAGKWVLSLQ
jgi:Uncharacterized protein conserved in bacteria (DUF2066)